MSFETETQSGDDVLQHVIRTPLPWRDATRTRCGREVAELAEGRVITIEEARAKVKRLGKQRAAMSICMTCANHCGTGTYNDWPEWDDSPVQRMARECEGARWGRNDKTILIEQELRAIAILIANHHEEFSALIATQEDGSLVTLSSRRATRRAARAYGGL